VSQETIVVTSIVQGVGLGLLFVPITSVAFTTLPGHLRTSGTAILTLVRNIGSSIGISMVIAELTSGTTYMHARLTEQVTPFNQALQMPDVHRLINLNSGMGRALADLLLTTQAQIIAFERDYQLVMFFILASIPLAIMIGSTKAALRTQSANSAEAAEHAAVLE
jgi:DHA2 family multidrug resistance protein